MSTASQSEDGSPQPRCPRKKLRSADPSDNVSSAISRAGPPVASLEVDRMNSSPVADKEVCGGVGANEEGTSATNREDAMDVDEDDDVEFLFTVPSRPSTADPTSRIGVNAGSAASEVVLDASQGGSGSGDVARRTGVLTSAGEPSVEGSSAASSDHRHAGPPHHSYTPVTSAYVQSLAEVAHILLHDGRWRYRVAPRARAGGSATTRPLFQWEHGDDLAVLLWLARRYLPPSPDEDPLNFLPERSISCPCLLCRDERKPPATAGASPNQTQSANPQGPDASAEEDRPPLHAQRDNDEGESDRSLYLYARLFYRKGPWFRLDDIFWRYYADHGRTSHSVGSLEKENHQPSHLDQARLEDLCKALESLITHVECLQSKGLLRTFTDEAECGRACDTSLLKKDERSIVLAKLGVRKPTGKPNEVWTQMRTQRPLFGKAGDGILLPVCKHVAETLKSRLLTSVVQACSPNYVSASKKRELVSQLVARFPALASYGCLRLRESPTLTLRRAVRLFVCATAGPGEMRGPANGWTSLRTIQCDPAPPLSQLIPPPGIHCFNLVSHPGLLTRFGRRSALFQVAYLKSTAGAASSGRHVFRSREAFVAWEMAVEVRAQVDYLLELTETLRSNERRKNRGLQPLGERELKCGEQLPTGSVDFWSLLSGKRESVVKKLLHDSSDETRRDVLSYIEAEVESCVAAVGESLVESEHILISIAVTCLHVLVMRCRTMEQHESRTTASQPWLRHLLWESVLAYILWDIIPVLERRELYRLAVKALETLLFGAPISQERKSDDIEVPIFPTSISCFPLSSALLSRRARGKAYDRLIIDHNHILSQDMKKSIVAKETFKARRDEVLRFCEVAVAHSVETSTISFSTVRCLARRIKRPLARTIGTRYCIEAAELGLRYENDETTDEENKRYLDWNPIVDTAIANALTGGTDTESGAVGGRCAFVGFEDSDVDVGSLNVEQLAMEYYRTGRFDIDNSAISGGAGGWVGWHDEGSHIRALFRILCAPVLGIDGYCQASSACSGPLILLSPYQQAPFDLHVGFSVTEWNRDEGLVGTNSGTGFFYHRRVVIDTFLDKLSLLAPQELCDLVHESIIARRGQLRKHDARFEQDCSRSRTLSLIAAGCGGPLLSSMFRCLFYDYRHYSGGLPDLLLVRATRLASTTESEYSLKSIEEWIGEGTLLNSSGQSRTLEDDEFLGCSKSGDAGTSLRAPRIRRKLPSPALHRGDESAPVAPGNETEVDQLKQPVSAFMPERLMLVHEDQPVCVECIMVEVKSSNDRLDPRQEDWLNVIDRHGRGRVCKFTAAPSVKSAEST